MKGKISLNYQFERDLKFRHTENSVTQSNPFLKWAKDVGGYFCKCTYSQQAWERCPASLVIRQMQIQTQVSSQICFHPLGWLCLYEMKRVRVIEGVEHLAPSSIVSGDEMLQSCKKWVWWRAGAAYSHCTPTGLRESRDHRKNVDRSRTVQNTTYWGLTNRNVGLVARTSSAFLQFGWGQKL